jgi:hypothetical protein
VRGIRALRFGREGPVWLVLLVVGVGLALIPADWRTGVYVMSGGCLLAAVLRLGLPARRAGLLAVRTRGFDVATLTVFGLAGVVLARLVPAT